MTSYSADGGRRPADPQAGLRVAALIAVIAGVILLAAAAFVLSYEGIHHLALRAGVSSQLARLYPVIFDAMMVIAAAAALALRGAGWWARGYAWFSLLLMLAAVAVGNAVYATNVTLPTEPTRAVVAVTPWVLLLLAFGLLLEMLRYFRRDRWVNGQPGRVAAGGAAVLTPIASRGNGGTSTGNGAPGNPAQRGAVTWSAAGNGGAGRALPSAPTGLEMLLGPRQGDPPAMPGPKQSSGTASEEHSPPARSSASHNPESVAYGEETGYVHPDSYRDHEDHAAAAPGDGSGPGAPDHAGHEDNPGHDHSPVADSLAAAEGAPAAAEDAAAEGGAADSSDGTAGLSDGPPAAEGGTASSGDAAPADGKEADGQAKKDGAKDPLPAVANSAEATAQATPTKTQDAPAPNGGTAALPPRSVMPLLERLRSTPAPPGE